MGCLGVSGTSSIFTASSQCALAVSTWCGELIDKLFICLLVVSHGIRYCIFLELDGTLFALHLHILVMGDNLLRLCLFIIVLVLLYKVYMNICKEYNHLI